MSETVGTLALRCHPPLTLQTRQEGMPRGDGSQQVQVAAVYKRPRAEAKQRPTVGQRGQYMRLHAALHCRSAVGYGMAEQVVQHRARVTVVRGDLQHLG